MTSDSRYGTKKKQSITLKYSITHQTYHHGRSITAYLYTANPLLWAKEILLFITNFYKNLLDTMIWWNWCYAPCVWLCIANLSSKPWAQTHQSPVATSPTLEEWNTFSSTKLCNSQGKSFFSPSAHFYF